MMYLKEAFRYQNFLSAMADTAIRHLSLDRNIMKTTQEHMRKKANHDAEDEIIDKTGERTTEYTPDELVNFLVMLVEERKKLGAAISEAKRSCDIDMDAEIAANKVRQQVAGAFKNMGNVRPIERVFKANDYKFNADGNQVPYAYDVKEVSVIDFDRKKVKAISKALFEEADTISTKIDKMKMGHINRSFLTWSRIMKKGSGTQERTPVFHNPQI